MRQHANSHKNMDEHHLYEIIDTAENNILKYEISGKPLREDEKSPSAEEQVRFLNRIAGWIYSIFPK
jgi:hypothetical protein